MQANAVFAEGIILSQQVFQQAEAYQQAQYRRLNTVYDFQWGILALDIDETALLRDQFRVLHIECIFPDGQVVLAQDLQMNLNKTREVYCQLALGQQVEGITAYPQKANTSWQAHYQMVADRYDSTRQQEVLLATPNVSLSPIRMAGYQQILLARLDANGQLDKEFAPACLNSQFAPFYQLARQCLLAIDAQCDPQSRLAPFVYSMRQRFHDYLAAGCHPQSLYHCLRELIAGIQQQVKLFDHDYQHEDCWACFDELLNEMKGINRRDDIISFKARGGHIWLSDRMHNKPCYLRVDNTFDNRHISRLKVGDEDSIEQMIASALSGIQLTRYDNPYLMQRYQFRYQFFRFDTTHPRWEMIIKKQRLAMYIPHELQDHCFELIFWEPEDGNN